ncbi:keratin [Cognatishimia sp. F0-27]|uniref:keratin n=1 Tax=Cognatishimia sp. F0-27 TaxID=2816855 RepID=UPI001D0C23EB|nr:keratin [Cognatishimia sp. F0-27]MCC1493757.1 hypothetical protein [Cognatishimia sp. F0-27]
MTSDPASLSDRNAVELLMAKARFWYGHVTPPADAFAAWLVDSLRPALVVAAGPVSCETAVRIMTATDRVRTQTQVIADDAARLDLADFEPGSVDVLCVDAPLLSVCEDGDWLAILGQLSASSVMVIATEGLDADQWMNLSDTLEAFAVPVLASPGAAQVMCLTGADEAHAFDGLETLDPEEAETAIMCALLRGDRTSLDAARTQDTGAQVQALQDEIDALKEQLADTERALREAEDTGAEMLGSVMDDLDQLRKRMRNKTMEDARKAVQLKLRQRLIRRLRTRPRILWRRGPTAFQKAEAAKVAESKLFDADWYTQRYADVRRSGMDPALHFIVNGIYEGRSPSKRFDLLVYYVRNPDDLENAVNPLTGTKDAF